MALEVTAASPEDAAALVEIHNAAARRLTDEFGSGPWSWSTSERGLVAAMRQATVYQARDGGTVLGTFALSTRKPWAIDRKFFSASQAPLYLTGMAVHPASQRKGIGRFCIEEAMRFARQWPADAIRLDAWDAAPGAGGFYAKCGFREVGRATYRFAPLVYFELVL